MASLAKMIIYFYLRYSGGESKYILQQICRLLQIFPLYDFFLVSTGKLPLWEIVSSFALPLFLFKDFSCTSHLIGRIYCIMESKLLDLLQWNQRLLSAFSQKKGNNLLEKRYPLIKYLNIINKTFLRSSGDSRNTEEVIMKHFLFWVFFWLKKKKISPEKKYSCAFYFLVEAHAENETLENCKTSLDDQITVNYLNSKK